MTQDILASLNNSTEFKFDICGHWLLFDTYTLDLILFFVRDISTICLAILINIVTVLKFHQFKRSKKTTLSRDEKKKSNDENNLIKMSIYISIMSVLTHVFMFATNIYQMFPSSFTLYLFHLFTAFSLLLKYILDCVLFYAFNRIFKDYFNKILGII